MRRVVILMVALAAATPTLAFKAQNRLVVNPGPGSDFTVSNKSHAGDGDFWCAAGDYVIRSLRKPERTQVYRASPEPRKKGQGITFTLDESRAVGTSGVVKNDQPQKGISASAAVQLNCFGFEMNPFRF